MEIESTDDDLWDAECGLDVTAFRMYRTNAQLIQACVALGYLGPERKTLDPCVGKGVFWKHFKPNDFTTHDLKLDGVDVRALPYREDTFDAVVFDGPYKLNGTPTPTVGGVDERYGVDVPATWQDRMQLIRDGMTECHRVLRPGGYLLVKCQDQVCSGKVRWQGYEFTYHGVTDLGLELVDELYKYSKGGRPQPEGRGQVHARRNYSTMLVFVK